MDALYTFRIGLSSDRPIREDRHAFISLTGEDSHAGMLDAQWAATAMAMGSLLPWERELTMPTSSELLSCEV